MKRLNLRKALVSLATAIYAIAGAATMQARADIVVTVDNTAIDVPIPSGGVFVLGTGNLPLPGDPDIVGVTVGVSPVGVNGIGSLLIDGVNTLTTEFGGMGGIETDSFGVATLTGPKAAWNLKSLGAGLEGTGVLNIWNGATVNVSGLPHAFCNPCDAVIAGAVTSTGIVSVQGIGSSLNVGAALEIGLEGRGFLTIADRGIVNAGVGFPGVRHIIADAAGSSGTVIVQGNGAQLNLTGRLTVSNGNVVLPTAENGFFAFGFPGAPSLGTLNVSDGEVNVTEFMFVGFRENATGTVNVGNGGAIKTGFLRVGRDVGASGTVNISNGGTLITTGGGFSNIGREGSGLVTVSGDGSTLTYAGVNAAGEPDFVNIGRGGFGALRVSGGGNVLIDGTGGTVSFAGFRLGRNANGVGVLTVRGLGSEVRVRGLSARADIGGRSPSAGSEPPSTGTMVIADGGMVIMEDTIDASVIVGVRPGDVGTIRVVGLATDEFGVLITDEFGEFIPSTLDAGKRLCLGLGVDCLPPGGIGILILEDGGVVNVGTFKTGDFGTLEGSGTVTTSGATFTNGGTIRPSGKMTINGRFVQTAAGTIVLHVNGTIEGEFDQLVLTGAEDCGGNPCTTLDGTIEVIVADDVDLTAEGSLKLVDTSVSSGVTGSADVVVTDEGGGQIASFQLTGGSGLTIQFTGVAIDIKPGSDPNSINLGSNGVVPVAILSSATFDATTVDPTSVNLASAGAKMRGNGTLMSSIEDVNGDGLFDLVIQVETTALGLTSTATEATLTGSTFDNVVIQGTDMILVVPQEN